MNTRRTFLTAVASLPFLGWLKPAKAEDVLRIDTAGRVGIGVTPSTEANIVSYEPTYLMAIRDKDGELVRIEPDGTVVVQYYGADKKAAKTFYQHLHLEGKTLYQRIAELEAENERLRK